MKEFRFNLFGVGAFIQFGKGGPRIQRSTSFVEVRSESALTNIRAADPLSPDDLVTKRSMDAGTTPKLPLPAAGTKVIVSSGTEGAIAESGVIADATGNLVVPGNLTVQGESVTVNSMTVEVEDKNIVLARSATTDEMADGGGITLKGLTDKAIRWMRSRSAWFFSEHIDLAPEKEIRVDGIEYLQAHSTTHLPEGDQLYFTDQRAKDANADHRSNTDIHITAGERDDWTNKASTSSLIAHVSDGDVHITPAERIAWNSGAGTLEKLLYGVETINPLATLHEQRSDIMQHVSARNRAAAMFGQDADVFMTNAATSSLSTGSENACAIGKAYLPNGLTLFVRPTSNNYALHLVNPETGLAVTPMQMLALDIPGGQAGVCVLPNDRVLIVGKATASNYNVYLYNPALYTAAPPSLVGTIPVPRDLDSVGTAAAITLRTGKALIAVMGTGVFQGIAGTAYFFYLFDHSDNSIVPSSVSPLANTDPTSSGGISMSRMSDGKVFMMVRGRSPSQSFYHNAVYDDINDTLSNLTPYGITTGIQTSIPVSRPLPNGETLVLLPYSNSSYRIFTADSGGAIDEVSSTAIDVTTASDRALDAIVRADGKVQIVVQYSSAQYAIYTYDPESKSLVQAGVQFIPASVTGAVALSYSGRRLLLFAKSTSTAYMLQNIDGPFGSSNRFQYPRELLVAGLV